MTTTFSPTSKAAVPEPTPWPDFVGHWPRLTGRQEPEFESRHAGDESEGDRCARFGVRVGLRCLPWEWQTVRAILSLQPADRYGDRVWTHRDVCIECTRQQGKTLILVLLIVFHLFVLRTKRIVYTAQRWSTAADVFDRVVTVINRVPSLRKRLAKNPSKRDNHGVIELRNGAKAEFAPRSQDFGRGYTEVDLLIHDEAYDLDARETANLEGAQRAARNPQTITVSTPPVFEEHPKCHRLAAMHRLGFARAPHLYYALYAAPADMSRDDPKAYRLAQPSYGVVGNDREMATTRQKAKSFADLAIFDADYMGRGSYPPPETGSNSEIGVDEWADMKADDGPLRTRGAPAVGLHRDPDSGVWVITAAQYTDVGRSHLEIGYSHKAASADVVAAVVELVAAWNPAAVAIKRRGDAAAIEAELIKAGVEPEMVDGGRWAQWCGGFLNAALSGRLSHSGQDALNDAAASAVRHDMPAGGFIWDEAAAGASGAALVSATLAHGALLAFGTQVTKMPARPVATTQHSDAVELDVMRMAF